MASARERAESALFGAASAARLGRYVLLGSTADGGMGIVYDAYDPQLQRKVALKVLHPQRQWDERAHDRLTNEARSLAKLDHPNVVKVHDVVTQDAQDAQVVIVMEWVDGVTLADWQRTRPRSWADVVGVYVQAGQGLAAAHGLGVVHRDFKPSNAIVGNDGRVRVLDFGLARSAASLARSAGAEPPPGEAAVAPPRPDPEAPTASLTATGALVGTPAYAAPEQLAGQAATRASDQFSFAVSLHRALEGVPPFAGDDAVALAASIRSGRIALAGDARAVPKWLRAVVARALAERPEARFPSMSALLFELTRPRGWRRGQLPLLVGACVAIAVLALVLRGDRLAECDGGVAEVARVWNPLESWRVQAALQVVGATPEALRIRDRVRGGIDDYRDRWIDGHRRACVASRKGEQSDDLLDRRMRCLDRRLGDLKATVDVVARLDAASAGNAMDIVARMPQLAECADADGLRAETAGPSDDQRDAVDAVRARISQAMALDRAGRSGEAVDAARAAARDSEQLGYPPLTADAQLTLGRILVERNQPVSAVAALHRARELALEHRLLPVAIEAAARLIYVDGKG
ncbi:MAG TPA: serine/threonine-protein kinase, partial [Kofleriaceae bacterium]|nr:serine/threonine-protein kinase [Kofleriaceae bacterium]